MISICQKFFESTNVYSEHPSGIIAPFGIIDPSSKNKSILASAQSIVLKDPEEQLKYIRKLQKK